MHLLSIPLSIMLLITTTLSASIPTAASPPPNSLTQVPYPVVPAMFNGTIHGLPFTANGTMQEVYSQFYTLHPEITPLNSTQLTAAGFSLLTNTGTNINTTHLDTRFPSTRYCIPVPGQPWRASVLAYLPQILGPFYSSGKLLIPPRYCAKIACGWQTAIWLCNDAYFAWANPALDYLLTSFILDIQANCVIEQAFTVNVLGNPTTWWVLGMGGQKFDTDGFNVIIHEDTTCN